MDKPPYVQVKVDSLAYHPYTTKKLLVFKKNLSIVNYDYQIKK